MASKVVGSYGATSNTGSTSTQIEEHEQQTKPKPRRLLVRVLVSIASLFNLAAFILVLLLFPISYNAYNKGSEGIAMVTVVKPCSIRYGCTY